MKVKGQWTVQKTDGFFSKFIRHRDGKCQKCGKVMTSENTQSFHCAHIRSRRYGRTRMHEKNAIALCAGCHRWWHEDPVASGSWFIQKFGQDRYDLVFKLSQEVCSKKDAAAEAQTWLQPLVKAHGWK